MAEIEDLYDAVEKRKCVLFLGAGVHHSPPDKSSYVYPEEHRPPEGDRFSCELADECIAKLNEESKKDVLNVAGLDDARRARCEFEQKIREEQRDKKRFYLREHRRSLQRSSWYYEVHRERSKLVEKIGAAVKTGKEPSPIVRALAEIDFPIVITTNYDQLFEKALRAVNKDPIIRIYDPTVRPETPTRDFPGFPDPKLPWLFKMHGCVSEPNSIVVTDEDYIHFVMRMGDREDDYPVPLKIRAYFQEYPTLFVGYSLLDYNLRLLFRTLRRRLDASNRPATFSLDPSPDLLVLATYGVPVGQGSSKPLISFVEQDSWRFVPDLYQRVLGRPMPP